MNELLEKAKWVAKKAQDLGAQGVKASASRSRHSEVEWREGKLDRIRESTSLSISVSLYVNGRYSANSTSDTRNDAVEKFLKDTVAMTRVLAEDSFRKLPDPKRYAGRITTDLKLYDPAVESVTADERLRWVKEMEDAARSAPGAKGIISLTTSCFDDFSEGALVCSNGMEGYQRGSGFDITASMSVKDGPERKQPGAWWGYTRHKKDLPSTKDVGLKATQRAVSMVGAEPEKTGQYPFVMENMIAKRLVGSLLGPLSGSSIQQKRSFMADKMDQQIGSELLTITDDPHIVAGLGSQVFDGEGMASMTRPVIEKGVVKLFYLDNYYARKLGKEATSGGTSNLVYQMGSRNLDELLKEMGTGILVTGFLGGNSNSTTGDFSYGIRGFWVEKGVAVRPVARMNLSGNHLKFWNKLVEVGNDPYSYSSHQCPSLRFEPADFSGV